MNPIARTLAAGILGAAFAAAAGPAGAESGKEWPMYGGDYANTRHSSLNQINTRNVGKLRVAWIRSLGTLESQESTPLVIGDTMYVSTSSGPRYVFALNAKDGSIKWKYEPELPRDYMSTV